MNGLHSITLDSTIDDPEPLYAQNEDPYDANLSASFVPSTTHWMTEQETIRQCAQRTTASSATSGSPYGIMASAADFVAPRPLVVTVGNYLLMYADGRFTRHPRFRYFALNIDVRWRSLQAGRISARTHMMPSSFSSTVLTWLLFYHCSSITSTEMQRVYIGIFTQARPP